MNYYLLSYLWILSLSPLSLSLFFTIIYEGVFLLIVCFFIGIFLIIVVIIITTTNILHTGRESVFTPTYQIWFDRWAMIGKYVFLFVCLFCLFCFLLYYYHWLIFFIVLVVQEPLFEILIIFSYVSIFDSFFMY